MKKEIDFKKVVEKVLTEIENKNEVEKAISDTIIKFPNLTREEIFLRLIQCSINGLDFTDTFKLQQNKMINSKIDSLGNKNIK